MNMSGVHREAIGFAIRGCQCFGEPNVVGLWSTTGEFQRHSRTMAHILLEECCVATSLLAFSMHDYGLRRKHERCGIVGQFDKVRTRHDVKIGLGLCSCGQRQQQ